MLPIVVLFSVALRVTAHVPIRLSELIDRELHQLHGVLSVATRLFQAFPEPDYADSFFDGGKLIASGITVGGV